MADVSAVGAAELRVKYDASTRLLAAQCDTIERLHAQVQALQRQQAFTTTSPRDTATTTTTTTTWRGGDEENRDGSNTNGSSCGGAGSDAAGGGFETKYRRAKRLVKMQVRVVGCCPFHVTLLFYKYSADTWRPFCTQYSTTHTTRKSTHTPRIPFIPPSNPPPTHTPLERRDAGCRDGETEGGAEEVRDRGGGTHVSRHVGGGIPGSHPGATILRQ